MLAGRAETLSGGHGQALYEDVMLAAAAPLFTPGRFEAILRLIARTRSSGLEAFEYGATDGTLLIFDNPGIAVWKQF